MTSAESIDTKEAVVSTQPEEKEIDTSLEPAAFHKKPFPCKNQNLLTKKLWNQSKMKMRLLGKFKNDVRPLTLVDKEQAHSVESLQPRAATD